jgi:hypothetical protein
MASADLVQTNGLGLSLASAMKRLMAVCSSTIAVKTPAFEALPGEPGKPVFDRVGPRTRRRREVEGDARMACEPAAHLGVLVGSIVVEDHMDGLVGRHFTLDGIEKADKFLVPVALHAAPDDQDIEGGEQGGTVAQRPFFIGRPGWVRSRAWIWLFSSRLSTTAWLADRHRGRLPR